MRASLYRLVSLTSGISSPRRHQSLNITISPPPSTDITSRRNRLLSISKNRSGALKADLATELERNAQPQLIEVMLRRSDRISKQKERINILTSSTKLSLVVILHIAPFPRFKSKDRVIDIKPDRSWGKPREYLRRGKRILHGRG